MDFKLSSPALHGVMAEFDNPTSLVEAARRTYDEGYRRFESYSPYPVHEVFDAMHIRDKRVSLVVLLGGLTGMLTGIGLQVWVSAIAYPLNIAGRPLYSWPAFVVPAYEWTILWAGLSAAFGMIALNHMPSLYHPLFNAPNFRNGALVDKFFLCLEALDPKYDAAESRTYLETLDPVSVTEVEY